MLEIASPPNPVGLGLWFAPHIFKQKERRSAFDTTNQPALSKGLKPGVVFPSGEPEPCSAPQAAMVNKGSCPSCRHSLFVCSCPALLQHCPQSPTRDMFCMSCPDSFQTLVEKASLPQCAFKNLAFNVCCYTFS